MQATRNPYRTKLSNSSAAHRAGGNRGRGVHDHHHEEEKRHYDHVVHAVQAEALVPIMSQPSIIPSSNSEDRARPGGEYQGVRYRCGCDQLPQPSAKPYKSNRDCSQWVDHEVIAEVCAAFLARARPVSPIAKPQRMTLTDAPATSTHTMLLGGGENVVVDAGRAVGRVPSLVVGYPARSGAVVPDTSDLPSGLAKRTSPPVFSYWIMPERKGRIYGAVGVPPEHPYLLPAMGRRGWHPLPSSLATTSRPPTNRSPNRQAGKARRGSSKSFHDSAPR